MTLLDELDACERGRIVVAQIARAISQANTPELEAKLKDYLLRCSQQCGAAPLIRKSDGTLDVMANLVAPIVFDEPPHVWFFSDKADVERRHTLATLVEANTFRFLTGITSSASAELNASDVANTTSRDFEGAKLGPTRQAPKRNIFWATRFEKALEIAPAIQGSGTLPTEQAKRLRDYLGLSHLGSVDAVLLVLEADAAETHDGEVCRPFLFDGIGNPCFHLFDRNARLGGWNCAFNLAHLDDEANAAEGAPEVVLSSMPATRVQRCVLVGKPPTIALEDADVLSFMLGDVSYAAAKEAVRMFMEW